MRFLMIIFLLLPFAVKSEEVVDLYVHAQMGEAAAEMSLADKLYVGELPYKRNFIKALGLYLKNFKRHPELGLKIYKIYRNIDNEVGQSWRGFSFLKVAADSGNPEAQFWYAFENEAFSGKELLVKEYLTKSASANFPKAIFEIGRLHLNGRFGFEENEGKAYEYLGSAALLGDKDALELLSKLYYSLPDGDVDVSSFLMRASKMKQFDNDLQLNVALGFLYAREKSKVRDEKLAFIFFKKAALLGDPLSQEQLGVMYFNGVAGNKSLKDGCRWLAIAAINGRKAAGDKLAKIGEECSRNK